MSSFQALADQNDDDVISSSDEYDSSTKANVPAKTAAFELLREGENSDVEKDEDKSDTTKPTPVESSESKKKKTNKKKKKQKIEDDFDIDAALAEINAPHVKETKKKGEKMSGKEVKKDEQLDFQEETSEPNVEPIEAETIEPPEESKRKKKKKKKEAAAKMETERKTADEIKIGKDTEDEVKISEGTEAEDAKKDTEEQGSEAVDKKKKKKKKEKKDDEEKEKKKSKKANVSAIKEFLRKKLEEEERIRKLQEEEQLRLEAQQKEKEEKERLEKEKKEKAKERKKAKILELKKEGKYLSDNKKAKLAKQRETIEHLKQQGLIIGPDAEVAKKPRPKYIDKKRQRKQQQQNVPSESYTAEKEESVPETPETEYTTEDLTDGLDAEKEEDEDVAESWEGITVGSSVEAVREKPIKSRRETPAAAGGRSEVDEKVAESESDGDSSEEDESSGDEESSSSTDEGRTGNETKEEIKEKVLARIKKRKEEAESKRSVSDLRSPVICVLGHVDTGKTKILDKIRRTNVQDGEAGGITQQIGATMVPASAICEQGRIVKEFAAADIKLPGFLIIDTPGHESFSNLRSRGSSLCDVAILVVDIMHGLEPQTLESIELLLKRKTPFIVALNKVDRLYNWKQNPHKDIRAVLKSQDSNCQIEFQERYNSVVTQFAEKGLNIALAWENKDPKEYHSVIPTSAHSGDGMGNLMVYIAQYCQDWLADRLAYSEELSCTVLEVKTEQGLGTFVDVVLVNGKLKYGDVIILAGLEGPIVTQVRELLMPQPLKELRVKNPYQHFKEIKGAQGVRLLAKELDKTLAGLPLLIAHTEDEVDVLRSEVAETLERRLKSYKVSERGVYVQASTLGSLEALLAFLDSQKITYCGINIGPVHKKDAMKASTMLEHDAQWAVILAFDVEIDRDAQKEADKVGVKIFAADIIYHLQDKLLSYREELRLKKRQENATLAIFPCKLRILPNNVFNKRDPIVVGVSVESGQVKPGTPICVPSRDNILLGTISSIELNHKALDIAKSGVEVCIKIENTTGDAPKMYDRHFTYEDILVSRISRESIDVCKAYFREDLSKDDWRLIVELKKLLNIF